MALDGQASHWAGLRAELGVLCEFCGSVRHGCCVSIQYYFERTWAVVELR